MDFRLEALLTLEGYAWALQAAGQDLEAVRMLAAAVEFRERSGAVLFPRDKPFHDRVVAELHKSLDEAAFEAAWEDGHAAGFEKVISEVLEKALDTEGVKQD